MAFQTEKDLLEEILRCRMNGMDARAQDLFKEFVDGLCDVHFEKLIYSAIKIFSWKVELTLQGEQVGRLEKPLPHGAVYVSGYKRCENCGEVVKIDSPNDLGGSCLECNNAK